MIITSNAFENNGNIPVEYTCDGADINPPLSFSGVPENTQSLALIVDDPDAPSGTFDHWVVFNISPFATTVEANSIPNGGIIGISSTGRSEWVAPCPPSGVHRYRFKLYALDTMLNLMADADKKIVEEKMQGHIIVQAELTGFYSRNK